MTNTLPKGWSQHELNEICNVEYGTRVVRKRDGGTTFPVYGGGGATFYMDRYNRENCLIVARFAMSEQCTRFVSGKFFLNDSGLTVTPINTDFLTQKFLDWQLISLNNTIYSLGDGSAQKNLKMNLFRKLNLRVPSLPEQKRIVEKLDKIFANIDKAKEQTTQNLKNAKGVFLNGLEYLFTTNTEEWKKYSLADLGDIQTGTTPPTSQKDNFGSYIPFIKPSDFYEDGTLDYDQQGLSDDGLKKSRLIRKKSILMVCIGATITKTGFSDTDVACNQQINALTPTRDNHKFIYYAMIRPSFKQQVLRESPQTTLPIINKTKWSKLTLQVPSLEEQNRIVEQLDNLQIKIQELEKIYTQKLADLDELKQSVLQQAFSGKL